MLTKTEIARQLHVANETVNGWIESGELRAIDVRRLGTSRPQWRITQEDFDAFLQSRRNVGRKTVKRVRVVENLV